MGHTQCPLGRKPPGQIRAPRLTLPPASSIAPAMLIYKVLRAAEWAEFDREGRSRGSAVDRTDGFVHFSTAQQLATTLSRHFAGETGLTLLALDADRAGAALRWEPSRGGALFPHLYRALDRGDILWARALEDGPEGAMIPAEIA